MFAPIYYRILLVLAVIVGTWLPAASQAELADTIARVKPSIVAIGTVQFTRRPPARYLGTGFVVGNGRQIITNAHNIPAELDEQHREFLAVFAVAEQKKGRKARVVAVDRDHDLALLSVEGRALPALSLGDSDRVREGEHYAFTGFPIGMVLGVHPVTHRGIISAITPIAIPQLTSRLLDAKMIKKLKQPYKVFQLDATAYPGNSGSPLYDTETGSVIGVINKVFVKETKENLLDKPSGITYAIPSRYARQLLQANKD